MQKDAPQRRPFLKLSCIQRDRGSNGPLVHTLGKEWYQQFCTGIRIDQRMKNQLDEQAQDTRLYKYY